MVARAGPSRACGSGSAVPVLLAYVGSLEGSVWGCMIVKECRSHSWNGHGGGCWAGSLLCALVGCSRVAGEGDGEGRGVLRLAMAVDRAKGSRPHQVWGCSSGSSPPCWVPAPWCEVPPCVPPPGGGGVCVSGMTMTSFNSSRYGAAMARLGQDCVRGAVYLLESMRAACGFA